MEEWMKKRAALYMLIKFVDENKGCIDINSDKVKRVFNDENEVVKIEYADGKVGLLADADFDTMNDAVLKWKSANQ
jgi:exoribonuclease R